MFVSANCASWMKQVPFHGIEQVENWYSFRWNLDVKCRLLCRCMILGLQQISALLISDRSFSYRSRNWCLLRYMVLHIDERHRQHLRRIIFVYYLTLFGNKILDTQIMMKMILGGYTNMDSWKKPLLKFCTLLQKWNLKYSK